MAAPTTEFGSDGTGTITATGEDNGLLQEFSPLTSNPRWKVGISGTFTSCVLAVRTNFRGVSSEVYYPIPNGVHGTTGSKIDNSASITLTNSTAVQFEFDVSGMEKGEVYVVSGTPTSVVVESRVGAANSATTIVQNAVAGTQGVETLTQSDAGVVKQGTDFDIVFGHNGSYHFARQLTGPWANDPPSPFNPPSVYHEMFDDFVNPASATASDAQAWTAVNDGGTGTPAFQDAAGGVFNVVTAAADNDYSAYSSVNEVYKFEAGKKLWFEARFKVAEATTNESAWWFGLTDTLTTGGLQANAAGPLASYDGALIWKDEATMAIDFETSNAGTQNTTTNMGTFVTNTWTRVGFYFDGTATTSVVTPYIDVGSGWAAGTPQNVTLSGLEEMHAVFGIKAGPTAAAETLQVDYVKVLQLR